MAKRKDETPDELTQDVADAAARVQETGAALAQAQADHDAAKADHAEATKAAEPVPDKAKHIFVEGANGQALLRDAPKGHDGENPARRISLNSINYEHVGDHPSGIWIYRAM
jgi:hypothetical protein